jgi:hypothetical protein
MGHYETPQHNVLFKDNNFEIREYTEFSIVEYDNEMDPNINNGFGTLFRYISKENTDAEKIAMTIPVIEEVTSTKKKMAFVVPSKYGDQIPQPKDSRLTVKKFDKGMFAVIVYSGFSSKEKEIKMKNKLANWLEVKGYKRQSNYMLAFYNPPFTPPMFRRNEIMVRVVNSNIVPDLD